MGFRFRSQSLLPEGLIVDGIEYAADTLVAIARSPSRTSSCPVCGRVSAQIHSRYERSLGDLPTHGRQVRIRLQVRHFRCQGDNCPRRIFAERLAPNNGPLPAGYYRKEAARMRRLAADATTHAVKEQLCDVAVRYERLAESAEDAARMRQRST